MRRAGWRFGLSVSRNWHVTRTIHPTLEYFSQFWGAASGRSFEEILFDKRYAAAIDSEIVATHSEDLYCLVGGSAIDMYELGTVTGRIGDSPNPPHAFTMTDVSMVDVLGVNLVEAPIDLQEMRGPDAAQLGKWFT